MSHHLAYPLGSLACVCCRICPRQTTRYSACPWGMASPAGAVLEICCSIKRERIQGLHCPSAEKTDREICEEQYASPPQFCSLISAHCLAEICAEKHRIRFMATFTSIVHIIFSGCCSRKQGNICKSTSWFLHQRIASGHLS